jgi:hypothetical protein
VDRSTITDARVQTASALLKVTAGGQLHKFDFARGGSLAWLGSSSHAWAGPAGSLGRAVGAVGSLVAVAKGRGTAESFVERLRPPQR